MSIAANIEKERPAEDEGSKEVASEDSTNEEGARASY